MKFEVEISYKANLDIRHIYEYYVMNNFDLNYVKHLINGIWYNPSQVDMGNI